MQNPIAMVAVATPINPAGVLAKTFWHLSGQEPNPDDPVDVALCAARAIESLERALAAIEGRDYVRPDDVKQVAHPVLSHRLMLSSQTRLRGRTSDDVLDEILRELPVPIADRP